MGTSFHVHEYDWASHEAGYHRLCECGFRPDNPAWRVLVTASRDHIDGEIIYDALADELYLNAEPRMLPMVVIHGAAPGGDTIAHEWTVASANCTPDPHPANWRAGKQAGHVRNQLMVDLGADVCLGFPLPDSTGTWDCLRRAEDAGIPTKTLERHD